MASNSRPAPTPTQARGQARADAFKTALFLGGLAIVGMIPTALVAQNACGGGTPRSLLWALGLWASGTAIGFLFGIPKVLQGPQPATKRKTGEETGPPDDAGRDTESVSPYQQRVNTNLEEISDWLTKIIVGMGLVELREMPRHIRTLGAEVVGASGAPCDPTFGVALVVFFSVAGFLFGYLVTRLYMQGALARAEAGVAAEAALVALELRAESAEAELQAVKEVAPTMGVAPGPQAAVPKTFDEAVVGLRALGEQYKAIRIRAYWARVEAKNLVAAKMYAYIVEHQIPRDWLAQQDDEALLLALATLVLADPADGDTKMLLTVASKVERLHVRYKIVLALSKLWDVRIAGPADREAILTVLETYSRTADDSLLKLIRGLRQKLEPAAVAR